MNFIAIIGRVLAVAAGFMVLWAGISFAADIIGASDIDGVSKIGGAVFSIFGAWSVASDLSRIGVVGFRQWWNE